MKLLIVDIPEQGTETWLLDVSVIVSIIGST